MSKRCLAILVLTFWASSAWAVEQTASSTKERVTSDSRDLSFKPLVAYSARGRKDPFLAPQFRRLQQDPASVLIRQIGLVGLVQSGRHNTAMFQQAGGSRPTLVLKGGKLYYDRTHCIEGVAGSILDSRRVFLKQGDECITYTLFLNHR